MPRMIDVERFCADNPNFNSEVYVALSKAPTIDAVPVVRCKDCKHSTTFHHTGNMYCGLHENHHFLTDADGFCNKGERRCDNDS